jgi:hypothetical protein
MILMFFIPALVFRLPWNRQMNRDGVTINWQFTRRKTRKKFGYNRSKITRSQI